MRNLTYDIGFDSWRILGNHMIDKGQYELIRFLRERNVHGRDREGLGRIVSQIKIGIAYEKLDNT